MNAFTSISHAVATATVADAVHVGLVRCSSDESLKTVAALMSENRVHCVVVMDDPHDERSLRGVVSDDDLIAAATVRALDGQTAGSSATKPAVSILPTASLEDAARRMTLQRVSHLVVVDSRHRPIGVLSTLDLAQMLAV